MADGSGLVFSAIGRGVEPDPELLVDEWSEEFMILPRSKAAEHGPYRNDRTPFARKVMRCLSPGHPCRRVVVRAASQLMKTQAGINWISAIIDMAPANALVLMPTLSLAKRLASRLGETFKGVQRVRDKVAAPRSRDSRNTIDTKEFDGGTLYITTAGSASNLAEIPARYAWGDEVDRWDLDVDGEGDPIMLVENRTSTYSSCSKQYYTSSPGIKELSRIDKLIEEGTDEYYHVPCPHCGEKHRLDFDNLHADESLSKAWMACPHCGGTFEEASKTALLAGGEWVPTRAGDGQTISFSLNALYAPFGWVSWLKLARERDKAERALEAGDSELMQVFVNTRKAESYSDGKTSATRDELVLRSEQYAELTIPNGALIVTAGVDVQHDRLACSVWAWGRGLECWLIYWGEFHGETAIEHRGAWADLEQFLFEGDGTSQKPWTPASYQHESGARLRWQRCSVDTGDGSNQEAAYAFCRRHRARGVLAVKGGSERGVSKLEIFAPPKTSVDTDRKDKAFKHGLRPYIVGTHKAKDLLIRDRLPLCDRLGDGGVRTGRAEGRIHWYAGVRHDWFDQMLSEVLVPSKTQRGRKVWVKKAGAHNEALDTFVYSLHAVYSLKANLWRDHVWTAIESHLRQAQLLPSIPEVHSVDAEVVEAPLEAEAAQPPRKPSVPSNPKPRSGFSVTRW